MVYVLIDKTRGDILRNVIEYDTENKACNLK